MANLAGNTLYKREGRVELFLSKLCNNSPFELMDGSSIVLESRDIIINTLTNKIPLGRLSLTDINGNTYKFSDLKKTEEFGKRGSGTYKEDLALDSLIGQIDKIKKLSNISSIKLSVNSVIYDIVNAESTTGCPKSDFHLLDSENKDVVWISHKDGTKPKHFQQWGGISSSREPLIYNHGETQQFIHDLKMEYPEGLPPKTTVYRHIEDATLKMLSVYGNKYGSDLGPQNVTMLLQGSIELAMKDSDTYELNAAHVHYNGDSVDSDNYEPVFMAIYKGDRSNSGVIGTRLGISPIGSRTGTHL